MLKHNNNIFKVEKSK